MIIAHIRCVHKSVPNLQHIHELLMSKSNVVFLFVDVFIKFSFHGTIDKISFKMYHHAVDGQGTSPDYDYGSSIPTYMIANRKKLHSGILHMLP